MPKRPARVTRRENTHFFQVRHRPGYGHGVHGPRPCGSCCAVVCLIFRRWLVSSACTDGCHRCINLLFEQDATALEDKTAALALITFKPPRNRSSGEGDSMKPCVLDLETPTRQQQALLCPSRRPTRVSLCFPYTYGYTAVMSYRPVLRLRGAVFQMSSCKRTNSGHAWCCLEPLLCRALTKTAEAIDDRPGDPER